MSFSIFFNPILISELRRSLRGKKFFIIQTVYLTIMSFFLFVIWMSSLSRHNYNYNHMETGRQIFFTIAYLQYVLMALLCPSFTCGAISGEKEKKTFELLITTPLKPSDIVWGKVLYSFIYSILYVITSLPFTCISFFFGGISPFDVFIMYISIFFSSFLFSLLGLYCSASSANTNIAIRNAYGSIIIVIFVISFFTGLLFSSKLQNGISFIFFHMPAWVVIVIIPLWITVFLFFSTRDLLEIPVKKYRFISRVMIFFLILFSSFPIAGFVYEEIKLKISLDDMREGMLFFYITIIIISMASLWFVTSDPVSKSKVYPFFKGLFYSNSYVSFLFAPFVSLFVLILFSSIFILCQPVLFTLAFHKIMLSICISSIILFTFSFIGKIICDLFSNVAYSRAFIFILFLITNIFTLPLYFINYNNDAFQHIMEFAYLNPGLAMESIWIGDARGMLHIGNNRFPLYIPFIIIYSVIGMIIFIFYIKFVKDRKKYVEIS